MTTLGTVRLPSGFNRVGSLAQINTSPGGVPKLPISHAAITTDGITGDLQRNLRFHGGLDRALCIWSEEIIDVLTNEGHNLAAGHAGENLTLRGIDWAQVRPGQLLHIASIIAEITSFARPCKTNARWFVDENFRRIDNALFPGWSRVYARVLVPGTLTTGAPVHVD